MLEHSHDGRSRDLPSGQSPATADPPSDSSGEAAKPRPITPNRIQALLGITCAVVVAANLGVPYLHAGVAMQVLLTVVGFRVARTVHRSSSITTWRPPLVLGLAARGVPTVLLVVGLITLYALTTGELDGSSGRALAATAMFLSDLVPFLTDAGYPALDHFWAVALVGQTLLLAVWLLTAHRQRICARDRALLLTALAVGAAAVRIGWLTVSAPTTAVASAGAGAVIGPDPGGPLAVWTSLDALLLGLAVGTAPLASLHRRPTTRFVTPAVLALALLLVAPTVGTAIVDVGLRLPLVAALVAVVLAAEVISGLPRWLSAALTNASWHRLGSRSFGLYLWHIPFAYALTGSVPDSWPGLLPFVAIVTLALAAATTTYRSIELPVQSAVAQLGSKWFPPETMVLPQAEPQSTKWARWDEMSLDHLPLSNRFAPRRRRPSSPDPRPEPLGRRLWISGDRHIDLRAEAEEPVERPQPDRPAAAG